MREALSIIELCLQLAESTGITCVMFCSGAQNFKYTPLKLCVFFTGRYMGAMFQLIWESLSLECILKVKLSWSYGALASVCLLSMTLRCCEDWWNYIFLCLSSLLGLKCLFSHSAHKVAICQFLLSWPERLTSLTLLLSSVFRNSSMDEEIENPYWSVRALVQQYEGQQRSPSESSCSR